MRRTPLPPLVSGPSYASDWATGDVTDDAVWYQGKWWTGYHYTTVAKDRARDQERRRRNRAVSRFLSGQATDPGL